LDGICHSAGANPSEGVQIRRDGRSILRPIGIKSAKPGEDIMSERIDPRIVDLYYEYAHTHFDRRVFIERAAKLLGSTAAASSALALLIPNDAHAAVVAEDDARIVTERVSFPGATGAVKAYLARPKDNAKHGAVEVIHAIGGISPHIEDLARRFAVEGYVALSVDFLSPVGGTPVPRNPEVAKITASLKPEETTANAVAAVRYLRSRPEVNGKVAAIGFCWGGGVINQLAVHEPTLNVADVFYGRPPEAADVPKIKARLILNYADPELDKALGMLFPTYVEQLKAAGVKHELHVYPGAYHAFFDDTGQRHDAEAAKLAWQRTLAVFKETLS
jgi:carboxymethylenebutenolidase